MLPIEASQGSHEDKVSQEFPRMNNTIMSWKPSRFYEWKSWVPFEDIVGHLSTHGEAATLNWFFTDQATGYSPSCYFVYDSMKISKEFIKQLPEDKSMTEIAKFET